MVLFERLASIAERRGETKFGFQNKKKERNCQGVITESVKEELSRTVLHAAPISF